VIAPFFFEESLLLALLAAVLAADDRAGWQSLLAHPVFASIPIALLVGERAAALWAGVALELVWLAVLPMRGARRPDMVTGGIVGIGSVCLVLRHTADTRVALIVACGVAVGLVAGEVAGFVVRVVNRVREMYIAGFQVPKDGGVAVIGRRLVAYHALSIVWTAATAAIMSFVALALSVPVVEGVTATMPASAVAGTGWWLHLVPVIGAAALVNHFWHRHLNRFLLLSAGIVMVILWVR
jgi:mannose/fructose/N-acetylgalactosamine-specific phosphotransferase system component IIC